MKRSTCASGSGYVPSDSIGFCVAMTRNGCGTGYVVCPIVTCRSCITSRSADCTLAGAHPPDLEERLLETLVGLDGRRGGRLGHGSAPLLVGGLDRRPRRLKFALRTQTEALGRRLRAVRARERQVGEQPAEDVRVA